jgi:hypothetical protein
MDDFPLLNRILICSQVGKIQVIAFQSLGGPQPTLGAIVPVISNPVIDLDSSWSSSDNSLTARYALDGMEQDTGDSRASNGSKVYFDTVCCSVTEFISMKSFYFGGCLICKIALFLCGSTAMYHLSIIASLPIGWSMFKTILLTCA